MSEFTSTLTGERRWVPAPQVWPQRLTTALIGVWLRPGENVEWTWVDLPDGTREIVGYTVTARPNA
ncbi:MAG: hypothetical protein GWN58_08910 [Anaerolineae bacterium]|nr:hypothetical protein [Anaerolineae bacterium]